MANPANPWVEQADIGMAMRRVDAAPKGSCEKCHQHPIRWEVVRAARDHGISQEHWWCGVCLNSEVRYWRRWNAYVNSCLDQQTDGGYDL